MSLNNIMDSIDNNFTNEFKEYINNEIDKFNYNSVMFELMECYIIYYTEFLISNFRINI